MKVLFFSNEEDHAYVLAGLRAALPRADFRFWFPGDDDPADYAMVWNAPAEMLSGRKGLKAIFNLAAGANSLLYMGDTIPKNIPIIRLEDAGMGMQMTEYVTHAVLHYYRRFDVYAAQQEKHTWKFQSVPDKRDFSVGIMGIGVLGTRIAQALRQFDFPVRGWSRSKKRLSGISCFAGNEELDDFLNGTQVLVCALPLTSETKGILNHETLGKLNHGAYLINVARGAHLIDTDLLAQLDSGHIAGATLDAFREEPLPQDHPFWHTPKIRITPHRAALGLRDEIVRHIVEKLMMFDRGEAISGIVDRFKGY